MPMRNYTAFIDISVIQIKCYTQLILANLGLTEGGKEQLIHPGVILSSVNNSKHL